jgi:hypothetical protein
MIYNTKSISIPSYETNKKEEKKQCLLKCFRAIDLNNLSSKISCFTIFLFELQRIFVSSLLIIPRFCDTNICSFSENIEFRRSNYILFYFLIFNFITLITFFILYGIEFKREILLIKYLQHDNNMAIDNNSIYILFDFLPKSTKNQLISINKYYKNIGYTSITFFILNTIGNSYIIYNFYFNFQTVIIFITNIFFMFSKLVNVYGVINTEEYILYSAYLVEKKQFNNILPSIITQQLETSNTYYNTYLLQLP